MDGIRRLYFYAASTAGFFALLVGAVFTARHVAIAWASGRPAAALAPDGGAGLWLLLAVGGLALWLGHWIPANRAARGLTMAAAAERRAFPRKAYFYLGQFMALTALLAGAFLAIYAALLWLTGGNVTPGEAIMSAAGAFPALMAWAYLRWENMRDDDLGREPGRAVYLRRAYAYFFAAAGLALAFIGTGELLRTVISLLVRPLDPAVPWRDLLAAATAALVVGLPLSLLAWRFANRAGQAAPRAEMNAWARVLLRYGALLLGTVVTLLGASYLIERLVLLVLRQPQGLLAQLPGLARLDWTHALAYLPPAVILWASFADGIQEDMASGGEASHTAVVRRLVRYGVAAATLAAFWFGLIEFARLILQVVLGSPTGGPAFAADWWLRFARATGLVLVAAPAWWGYWWSQQVRARRPGLAGHAERACPIRRAYLWVVVLVGAVTAVAALGFAAFLVLNWQIAGTMGGVRAAVAGAGAAAVVSLFWVITHGLVLRADERWLAAEMLPPAAPSRPIVAEARAALAEPGIPVAEPDEPKRYRREDLMAWASGGGQPTAQRPLVVIDGGDGAVGAALISALRRERPDMTIWPIGLNAAAQVVMLDALGGSNASAVPPDALARALVILGPADILVSGGLDGEVTPELVAAVVASPARVLLLPPRDPHLRWVAAPDWPLARWVENAVIEATNAVQEL
ncbi:MAG: DUF5671 domain-containing protein [Anaerolineae bacterium]